MSKPFAQPDSFKGRTVIVTGGAGSIGRPLSIALAKAGANVLVNDKGGSVTGEGSSPTPAAEVVEEIKALGGSAVADGHDVATESEAIVAAAIAAFGRLDVVINNAGIIRYNAVGKQTLADFRAILEVNTIGTVGMMLAAWPLFVEQGYGRIVNFSSDSTFGAPSAAPYVVSKAAVTGATRTFALEGEPFGIKVNAVQPTSASRMAGDTIADPVQREAFRQTYLGEGNLPIILALAHESFTENGQIFSTGAYAINHIVQGFKKGVSGLKTMEECLEAKEEILGNDSSEVVVPHDVFDFIAKKSGITISVDL